ncbi:MAG: hypothetical protein IPM79_14865 [Polyangiaceae bacterium]|jgi:hypothetical protein|nr:hypothetical protein [Polyangiaceae bacterium]MBK8938865.1 hypothetical protein [Polyangiaceae bacterium]
MKVEHSRGPNFVIEVDEGLATCRVWQRPDLTSTEGAACAEQISRHAEALASDPNARGFVFDLRQAPPIAGPRTTAAVGQMAKAYEVAGKGFAVITADTPMMLLQFRRVVREAAPLRGVVTTDEAEAVESVRRARARR